MNKLKVLAIIPARGGSKRLPGKNIKDFMGKPLINWTIDFVKKLDVIDDIYVSTDSDEIVDCCKKAGFIINEKRPDALATDTSSTVDVVLDVIKRFEQIGKTFEYIALFQPTSPLRDVSSWHRAINLINQTSCDAVVGVSEVDNHPYHVFNVGDDASLAPWYSEDFLKIRSQDLPKSYFVNGSLYIVKISELKKQNTFFPKQAKAVICKFPYEAVDIDTENDWILGEAYVKHYGLTS